MWCQQCDRELAKDARRGTKYCSDACRARAYRERQRVATPPRGSVALASNQAARFSRAPARASRNTGPRATGKRVALTPRANRRHWRVAFDEQVLAQAPDGAVGYRVVLPGRDEWDAPRVVPDAGDPGSPSFWRLRPLELPDDLRLRSGKLYRLLWVDAQGARVPPLGSRSLPALRFFLGPPDEARAVKSVERSSRLAVVKGKQPAQTPPDLVAHRSELEVPGDALRAIPTTHVQALGSTEQGPIEHGGEAHQDAETAVSCEPLMLLRAETQLGESDAQPQAVTVATLVDASSVVPTQVQADPVAPILHPQEPRAIPQAIARESATTDSDALTAARCAEEAQCPSTDPAEQRSDAPFLSDPAVDGAVAARVRLQEAQPGATASATTVADATARSAAAEDERAPSVASLERSIDDAASSPLKVTVQLGSKTIDVAEAAWAAVQAQLTAAQDGVSCIPKCSPPLIDTELKELTGIILHTEKCAAFMHELDCFHARVVGKPALLSPDFSLQPDELERIRRVACDPRLTRAAMDLRGTWIGLHMQGPDAMFRLPPPFVPLSQVEAGRIRSTLNSPARRAYAAYASKRVEALQTSRPLPPQPASELPPKVRRQIHQLFSDARLLTLLEHGIWTRDAEAAKQAEAEESDGAAPAPTPSR